MGDFSFKKSLSERTQLLQLLRKVGRSPMTTHVLNGTESTKNEKGSDMTDSTTDATNNSGPVKKAVATVGSAVSSAAGKAKDVATSDRVTQAKQTAVATVKDPEARKKAIESAKQNRSRLFAVAGAVAAVLLVRRVRKGRRA